jgi:hypothetical protein
MVPSVNTPSTSKTMILIRRARSVAFRLILQFYGFAPLKTCHPEPQANDPLSCARPAVALAFASVSQSSGPSATIESPCPTRPHPRLIQTTTTSKTASSSSPPPTISNADSAAETPAATAHTITSTSLAISAPIQPVMPAPPEPYPLSPAPQIAEMQSSRPHRQSHSTGTHTAQASIRSAARPVPSQPHRAPAH